MTASRPSGMSPTRPRSPSGAPSSRREGRAEAAPEGSAETPGRRTRLSEVETAQRMVDVGVARLEAEGLTVGLGALRMERVIADAGVSRATAYRRWPRREDFLADVLTATVRRTTLLPETGADVARLLDVIETHGDRLAEAQGRRDLVVEALRVASDADIRRVMASPQWRTYLALGATHHTLADPALRAAVGDALAETGQRFRERRAEVFAGMAGLIGYRLREPWAALPDGGGFLAMSSAAGVAMMGIVSTALPRPAWLDERRPLVLFGASLSSPWSEAERVLVTVFLDHLEPDPDIDWSAARVAQALLDFRASAQSLLAGQAPQVPA